MKSLVLRIAAPPLASLMLLVSVFVLLRGHNEPGGGFVGGLIAAAAFALQALAFGAAAVRRALPLPPMTIAAAGLSLAVLSGLPSLLAGRPFLTGLWWFAPDLGRVLGAGAALSTPLLFDTGVYLVVLGAVTSLALALGEDGAP